jgi:hypothetical protein
MSFTKEAPFPRSYGVREIIISLKDEEQSSIAPTAPCSIKAFLLRGISIDPKTCHTFRFYVDFCGHLTMKQITQVRWGEEEITNIYRAALPLVLGAILGGTHCLQC